MAGDLHKRVLDGTSRDVPSRRSSPLSDTRKTQVRTAGFVLLRQSCWRGDARGRWYADPLSD
jgi:hypothetical protein